MGCNRRCRKAVKGLTQSGQEECRQLHPHQSVLLSLQQSGLLCESLEERMDGWIDRYLSTFRCGVARDFPLKYRRLWDLTDRESNSGF